jgi:flagellar motor switch protein FliM
MAEEPDLKEGAETGDDMAAEWAAMLNDEKPGDSAEAKAELDAAGRVATAQESATRVLNQDEIDNLLGFDGSVDNTEKTGIQAILNSALVSYERLPMLEVVFDRLVRLLTTSLRNFTSDNVEVTLDSISSIRFGDYLNSIPLPAMLGVFKAQEWDNYGMMTVDSSLIYSVVDVLLGGRRGTAPMRVEGRPYTTIERNLVERMLGIMLADQSAAFEPLSPVTFAFERLEINPRFATIARPANAAILVKLRVDMEERGGKVEILLPYATLEPVRELLLQMFMGEKFGRDSIWEAHLAREMWRTDIEIEAVLDEQTMMLGQFGELSTGDTLLLNVTPRSEVELRCGGVRLGTGSMGRVGRKVSVRLSNPISKVHPPS